jgi:hypothetical protein
MKKMNENVMKKKEIAHTFMRKKKEQQTHCFILGCKQNNTSYKGFKNCVFFFLCIDDDNVLINQSQGKNVSFLHTTRKRGEEKQSVRETKYNIYFDINLATSRDI